jgi:chloride channel protein, CIC family
MTAGDPSPRPSVESPAANTPVAVTRWLPDDNRHGLGLPAFALLSVVLGLVAGLGAFVFRSLIAMVHNLLFLGRWSWHYDSLRHTPPSPWGLGVILVPVVGSVAVVFLVKNFAPEARGHGVPEVMDAIYYAKAVIRPIVAVIKALASALSIGSGGSVGREGPIIQIGAAFGSWSGGLCRVARWQRATLVAAGGGAGIAATFNTPIGGMLFAAEILLPEISVRTLVPVALATTTATYVSHFFFGDHPAFPVPPVHVASQSNVAILPAYVLLGVILAGASVVFIRGLYGAEDLLERLVPRHDYLRHALGMLVLGMTIALLMHFGGHYYVEGVGYATIMDVLSGTMTSVPLLLLLFVLKLAATSLTLGSGASGGIFSPSLVMGTTVGGAFGIALRALVPHWQIDPAAFALAGMAGMVAGATGAAMAAVVMMFEMTLDYGMVLPMTLTVAVSYGLRRLLLTESIYTMKLARRHHYTPKSLEANPALVHHVADIPLARAAVMDAHAPVDMLDVPDDAHATQYVLLVEGGMITGIVLRDWVRAHPAALARARTLGDLATAAGVRWVVVRSDNTIFRLLGKLRAAGASVAVVLGEPDPQHRTRTVIGVVTMAHLAEVLAEGMEMLVD